MIEYRVNKSIFRCELDMQQKMQQTTYQSQYLSKRESRVVASKDEMTLITGYAN
jgi:hypothetical protein